MAGAAHTRVCKGVPVCIASSCPGQGPLHPPPPILRSETFSTHRATALSSQLFPTHVKATPDDNPLHHTHTRAGAMAGARCTDARERRQLRARLPCLRLRLVLGPFLSYAPGPIYRRNTHGRQQTGTHRRGLCCTHAGARRKRVFIRRQERRYGQPSFHRPHRPWPRRCVPVCCRPCVLRR